MADVEPYTDFVAPGTIRYRWDGLSGGSLGTGKKVSLNGGIGSLTFQAQATNWSSLSLSLQGSMNGVDFTTLTTPTGGAAIFTANGLVEIEQKPLYVKIATTTGDTAAVANCILLQRGW